LSGPAFLLADIVILARLNRKGRRLATIISLILDKTRFICDGCMVGLGVATYGLIAYVLRVAAGAGAPYPTPSLELLMVAMPRRGDAW
jgi:hypothetical protein